MQDKTAIKICGITQEKEIEYLVEEDVEYAGVVMFVEKSKRNTSPEKAQAIVKKANGRLKMVAVTISPTVQQIQIIEKAGFDYIQIHGKMDEAVYKELTIPVIRAINVNESFSETDEIEKSKVTAILYDGSDSGTGKTFDWSLIKDINTGAKKLILAGGLKEDNIQDAIKQVKPDIVDVSSAVEYTDGRMGKDKEKIKSFIKKVRE